MRPRPRPESVRPRPRPKVFYEAEAKTYEAYRGRGEATVSNESCKIWPRCRTGLEDLTSLLAAYTFNHFWDIAIYRWRVIDVKQSSWSEWAFLPHYDFVFPWVYAPGISTIVVNVTRLERGFNACKTPRCIYPSIFNHFWHIASYWSNIATFSYPTSVYISAPQSEFRKDLVYTQN